MNDIDREGGWIVEVLAAKIPIHQIGPLIAYLCGSQTGGRKADVARQNGRKGGRPRKPMDGMLDQQGP